MIEIVDIRKHPVKSLQGLSVRVVSIGDQGVIGDRSFVVVRASDGLAMTQRNLPKMAQISAALYAAGDTPLYLELSAPGMPPVRVGSVLDKFDAPHMAATVWGDTVPGFDCGDQVAIWLTQFLGRPCRLIQRNYVRERVPAKDKLVPEMTRPIGFQDRNGILIISDESIRAVRGYARAEFGVPEWDRPPENWRMTLLVRGAGAFAEHHWCQIAVENEDGPPILMEGRKLCDRCGMPDLDPQTGAELPGPSVIDVLTKLQDGGFPIFPDNPRSERKPVLGMGFMLSPSQQIGRIRIGGRIEVKTTWG